MSLNPERLAQIYAMSDDELRDFVQADAAVDDLLREVENLRTAVRSLANLARTTADLLAMGEAPDLANLYRGAALANEIGGA